MNLSKQSFSGNPDFSKALEADQTMDDNEETKDATLPKATTFCVSLGNVSTG